MSVGIISEANLDLFYGKALDLRFELFYFRGFDLNLCIMMRWEKLTSSNGVLVFIQVAH